MASPRDIPAAPTRAGGLPVVGALAAVLAVAGGSIVQRQAGLPGWWPWELDTVRTAAEATSAWRVLAPVAVYFTGMLVLLAAWLRLVREARRGRVGVAGVLVAAGLWATPFLLGPPLASLDVYSYAAVGELAAQGRDPYEVGPSVLPSTGAVAHVDPLWEDNPTPYGPAFTLAARGVVEVAGTSSIPRTVAGFRVLTAVGVALLGWGLHAAARRTGHRPETALALVLASPLLLLSVVSGVHNEALMAGAATAGVAVCLGRPRGPDADLLDPAWLGGVALVAVGAAVKLPVLLLAGFLVAWRESGWDAPDWRPSRVATTAVAAGAVCLTVFAMASLAAGVGLGWLSTLTGGTDVFSYLSITSLLGAPTSALTDVVAWIGVGTAAGLSLRWLSVDLAAPAGAEVPVDVGRAGAGLLAVALLGPVVHPHYLLWGIPLLAVAATRTRTRWIAVPVALVTVLILPASVGPDLAALPVASMTLAVAALVPAGLLAGRELLRTW